MTLPNVVYPFDLRLVVVVLIVGVVLVVVAGVILSVVLGISLGIVLGVLGIGVVIVFGVLPSDGRRCTFKGFSLRN